MDLNTEEGLSVRQAARKALPGLLAAALLAFLPAALPAAEPASRSEIERSDRDAAVLLDVLARFNPESASLFGVVAADGRVFDLGPNLAERQLQANREAREKLKALLDAEKSPFVRQDLEILIAAADDNLDAVRENDRYNLPYFDVAQTAFQGVQALLDDRLAPSRRENALLRLRAYAGMEPGSKPLTELAAERTREKLDQAGLAFPFKGQLEKSLANSATYVEGIRDLFKKFSIRGAEAPLSALQAQLARYDTFVKTTLLPRANADFRLKPELYALALRQSGVDMPVEELTSRARASFREIQNEMQSLAPLVAREKGFRSSDYRDVLRELKKERIGSEEILAHYQGRIKDLEAIIAREHIVTLPSRPMRIRLASPAESSSIPAPHMRFPQLIGNTGEIGEFVLPLEIPGSAGEKKAFDDFNYAAASWSLTAHEGRPGHELQFASLIERGVSLARAIFALNSTNVEGWGLYAEAEMQPYEPLDGQFITYQNRLVRVARAILDPGLQRGEISVAQATHVLRVEVGLSEALAGQEIERYTYRTPGQAPSYFCGYQRLMALRSDAERILGAGFDRQRFNDFILSQGLLPPSLLGAAVREEFIPHELTRSKDSFLTTSAAAPRFCPEGMLLLC